MKKRKNNYLTDISRYIIYAQKPIIVVNCFIETEALPKQNIFFNYLFFILLFGLFEFRIKQDLGISGIIVFNKGWTQEII